jgi:aminoglycoside phosphotransferase (APT) family kinase protein
MIIVEATWHKDGQVGGANYVIRVASSRFQVMKNARFEETVRLQQALAEFGAFPVQKVRWFEKDPKVLGAPFCVMDKLTGRTPTENPSYNIPNSWVGQLTTDERRTLWLNGMRKFTSIYKTPDLHTRLSLPLRLPPSGMSGLEHELQYWEDFHAWAGKGLAHPVTLAARDWLAENFPSETQTSFAWGNARFENLTFDAQMNCIAVLDWELACLAGPLFDLGWWLHMDRVGTIAAGRNGRASGLGSRAQTLAVWFEETNIPIENLRWYEVFAAYRLVALFSRYFTLEQAADFHMSGQTRLNNLAVELLAELIGVTYGSARELLVPFPC